MSDLEKYRGILPYASELFGVYQPLLGWKSKFMMLQVDKVASQLAFSLFQYMICAPKEWSGGKPSLSFLQASGKLAAADWKATRVGAYVMKEANQVLRDRGRLPSDAEWGSILEERSLSRVVDPELREAATEVSMDGERFRLYPQATLSDAEARAIGAHTVQGTPLMVAKVAVANHPAPALEKTTESITAESLKWLQMHAPHVLNRLVTPVPTRSLEDRSAFVDPLATFDPETQLAVLSPIGIVHLYREYFFELDSFPGPPVGHVWLSPGATVELVEVNTRRVLEERTTEAVTETTTKTEEALTEHDELADAVKEENQQNMKFGVSTSWGSNWLVAHAEASANFGFETTTKRAAETSHKHMREQSEKLSSEIRRNFKTTFRNVTEVTDTSSRKYVIQNTTNELVNYELRRKMRKVAVQVQHIGTQMCWQAYVDEPGRDLGLAELVHVSSPSDLNDDLQPPESVPTPETKTSDLTVRFPYEAGIDEYGNQSHFDMADDFRLVEIDGNTYCKSDDAYIVFQRTFTADIPAPHYFLADVRETSVNPRVRISTASYRIIPPNQFEMTLHNVNFENNPALDFALKLIWAPDPTLIGAANTANNTKMAAYQEATVRKSREEYVKAVGERVKMASNVHPRPASDLREEERTLIYRALVAQLMQVEKGQSPHVVSELIRALFDVDKMLYFVAPEWWLPRERFHQQLLPSGMNGSGNPAPLCNEDKVGWGGVGAKDRNNYLITEESQPAPLGSSLGWLIQLDGDNHRNAFLNSPWVKAIIPIRHGREEAALRWLQSGSVEGSDGLDAEYLGPEPELHGHTIGEAIRTLAAGISDLEGGPDYPLATEKVFEKGFDPLEGGFRAPGHSFDVFDQWTEVLPTEQVVAMEVKYKVPE